MEIKTDVKKKRRKKRGKNEKKEAGGGQALLEEKIWDESLCFFCSLICHSLDKCSLGAVNLESKQEAYWKNSFFF